MRGQHHHTTGMRKLLPGGVVGIVEAHRLGQALDSFGRASEKMPAVDGAGTPIAPHVLRLFGRRQGWRVRWINAHYEYIKLLTDGQGEGPQGLEQTVEHQGAEIRTVVIHQAENDRLPAKIGTQGHLSARLIPEHHIEWDELL